MPNAIAIEFSVAAAEKSFPLEKNKEKQMCAFSDHHASSSRLTVPPHITYQLLSPHINSQRVQEAFKSSTNREGQG